MYSLLENECKVFFKSRFPVDLLAFPTSKEERCRFSVCGVSPVTRYCFLLPISMPPFFRSSHFCSEVVDWSGWWVCDLDILVQMNLAQFLMACFPNCSNGFLPIVICPMAFCLMGFCHGTFAQIAICQMMVCPIVFCPISIAFAQLIFAQWFIAQWLFCPLDFCLIIVFPIVIWQVIFGSKTVCPITLCKETLSLQIKAEWAKQWRVT